MSSFPSSTGGAGVRTLGRIDLSGPAFVRAKGAQSVAVAIPCRNEAGTIAELVKRINGELVSDGSIDQLLVIDDDSTDDSAALAAEAGAEVVSVVDVNQRFGPGRGKGNVLWASLVNTDADVVVWCDADVTSFTAGWVRALAHPLVTDDSLVMVKAYYERPVDGGGGGRTTELVARPLLSLYAPELSAIRQPLAGEYAVRRAAAAQVPFQQGWGVEIGLLLDLADRFGPSAIAQVDLGVRHHRHRPLFDLSAQAAEVAAAVLSRRIPGGTPPPENRHLVRADGTVDKLNLETRPPLNGAGT